MHIASATHEFSSEPLSEDERLLRAAFIYNFTKFTNWPENTEEEQGKPLFLCTTGIDKLVYAIDQLEGKK